jgi:hypothetical protein
MFKPGTRQRYRQLEVRASGHAVHITYGRVPEA